eukprot:5707549-Alexandrium_andersonii.AAC.1
MPGGDRKRILRLVRTHVRRRCSAGAVYFGHGQVALEEAWLRRLLNTLSGDEAEEAAQGSLPGW